MSKAKTKLPDLSVSAMPSGALADAEAAQNEAQEYELRKRELDLRERELAVREKQIKFLELNPSLLQVFTDCVSSFQGEWDTFVKRVEEATKIKPDPKAIAEFKTGIDSALDKSAIDFKSRLIKIFKDTTKVNDTVRLPALAAYIIIITLISLSLFMGFAIWLNYSILNAMALRIGVFFVLSLTAILIYRHYSRE